MVLTEDPLGDGGTDDGPVTEDPLGTDDGPGTEDPLGTDDGPNRGPSW